MEHGKVFRGNKQTHTIEELIFMTELTYGIIFLAGLASFLSPCVLPLVPAFLAYVSGATIKDIKEGKHAKSAVFINTVMFVLGFSVIFAAFGAILNSVLAGVSYSARVWTGRIGGIIIILFGLYLLGLVKLSWLQREHQFKVGKFKNTYITSFLFGAAFAVGWTPCVGAVLGSILTLAVTQPGSAFGLLLAYSTGLGLPFLIAGALISQATDWIAKISASPALRYFNYVMGVVLLALGILVFTDQLVKVANLGAALFIMNG